MGIDEKTLLREIEVHKKALKKDPASKEFLPLAEALRKLKRYDEAIDVCKKGLEKNPKYITGYIALIKIYLDAGKIENALEEAEKSLKLAPDNTTLLRLKGETEIKLGRKELALKTLERCYELSPDEPGLETLIKNLKEEIYKSETKTEEVKEETLKTEEEKIEEPPKSVEMEEFEEKIRETEEVVEKEYEEREEIKEKLEEMPPEIEGEEVISEEPKSVEAEEFEEKIRKTEEVIETEEVGLTEGIHEEPETLPETEQKELESEEVIEIEETGIELTEETHEETKPLEKEVQHVEIKSPEIRSTRPIQEPPIVIKEIKKRFDIQEAIGFALAMEKEGNLKYAIQLWMDVLKHEPSNIEAKRKIAELRRKIWKEKEEEKKKEIPMDNLRLLAKWIKKIKEGG